MTLSFVLWFIGIFFGFIILALLVLFIYNFGKKRARNNNNRALILAKDGNDIIPLKGQMVGKPSKSTTTYKYGKNRTVIVPNKYDESYVNGSRLIFIQKIGQVISSPFAQKVNFEKDERENLIYEAVESKIGGDVIKQIQGGTSGVNVVIIAIIALIVGVAGTIGYQQISKMYKDKQQPAQTQQLPQSTANFTVNQTNGVRIEHNE